MLLKLSVNPTELVNKLQFHMFRVILSLIADIFLFNVSAVEFIFAHVLNLLYMYLI